MIIEHTIYGIYEDIINAAILFLQEGYCTSYVHEACQKTSKRKMEEENSLRKKREKMEENLDKERVDLDDVNEESQQEDNSSDKDYIPEKKYGKYEFIRFWKDG